MFKNKASRLTVAGLAAALVILTAGGVAVASNMGFKLNKELAIGTLTGLRNANWISIPYNNPYGNLGAFCTQTGLVSTGLVGRGAGSQIVDGTGVPVSRQCGSPDANAFALIPGAGLQVVQPAGTAAPASIIIVGSHNPTLSITLPRATVPFPTGSFWFSVPYHTTASSIGDLCRSAGLTSTGFSRAGITRLTVAESRTGVPTSRLCGNADADTTALELGTFVQIRETAVGKTFIPAHF